MNGDTTLTFIRSKVTKQSRNIKLALPVSTAHLFQLALINITFLRQGY